jgi:hypothetical protein
VSDGEKNVRIRVLGSESVVSSSELNELLDMDKGGLIEIIGPDGEDKGVDSVYLNKNNEPVRTMLNAEQLRNRKAVGETNIVFGATDPKLDIVRAHDEKLLEKRAAEDAAWITLLRPSVPGIQFLENAKLGKEEATYYRQSLLSTNAGKWGNLVGNIGAFFLAGRAMGTILPASWAAKVAFSSRTSMLGKSSQLLAENALFDTQLYANHILNYNQEFSIEDWGNQVAMGMLASAPFALNWQLRWAAGRSIGFVANKVLGVGKGATGIGREALDILRDAHVVYGLAKGGKSVGPIHQRAAQLGVISRNIKRWVRKGRVAPEIVHNPVDALDNAIDDLARVSKELEKYTPEKLKGSIAEMDFRKARLRELSGEPLEFLDDLDFGNMVTQVGKGNSAIKGIGKKIRGLNKDVETPANINTTINEAVYNVKIQDAIDRLDTVGYGNILSQLDNTLHLESTRTSYGEWVRARFDARLGKASKTPGGIAADKIIKDIIEDPTIWTKELAGRGVLINEGIESIIKNYEIIDDFARSRPSKLDAISIKDVTELSLVDQSISEIQEGYKKLRDQGVFTTETVRSLEEKLGFMQKELALTKDQYLNVAKINRARESAATMAKDKALNLELGRPKALEELQALYEKSALESGGSLVTLKEVTKKSLLGLRSISESQFSVKIPSFGVIALKQYTTEEEKRELYDRIQSNIQAMVGNPEALSYHLNQATSTINQEEPILSQMLQQRAVGSVMYLASILPKDDKSYLGQSTPPHISVVDDFLDAFMATYEPISVGVAASMGLATPKMVRAIKATNPAVYAEMYSVITEEMAKLTPDERLKVSDITIHGLNVFLDGFDSKYFGQNLVHLQSTYSQTQSEEQVLRGTKRPGSTIKSPGPQEPGSDYTHSQRISGF